MAWPAYGRSPRKSCGCGRFRTEGHIEAGSIHGHYSFKERVADPFKTGRLAMRRATVGIAIGAVLGATALSAPALAQNEQFIPHLVYRTGAYAPNGIPFANGVADYYRLVNARDGGINGVRINYEECDTGYATDRGVECYERLKAKGPTGAPYVLPLSTGITFALTEKAPIDKI